MAEASVLFVRGGWLFEPDAPFEQTDLLIQDGRVVARASRLEPPADAKFLDARGYVVVPGLINAHTHSNQALERGLADNLPLDSWMVLASYGGAGARLSAEELYTATVFGALQMLHSGCTAVVDMARVDSGAEFDAQADAVVKAYEDVGMRAVVAIQYSDLDFFDSVPLHLVNERPPLPARPPEPIDTLLSNVERWVRRVQAMENPTISAMLGPSSVPRCSDALFERSAALAERLGVGMQTHLLSARSQVPLAQQRFGRRTVERLDELGCLSPRTSFAHAIWLDGVEIEMLGRTRSPVVSNPISNQKLGAGIAPLHLLRDARAVIALGTDGASSNDSQDMWETVKSAAILHKTYASANQWVAAWDALRWCWRGGAAVVGQPVGSLTVGCEADFALLRLDRMLQLPADFMANQLVYAGPGSSVDSVFVRGRCVLNYGRVVGVDEDAVWRDAQRIVDRLYGNIGARLAAHAAAAPALNALEQAVNSLPLPIERRADVR